MITSLKLFYLALVLVATLGFAPTPAAGVDLRAYHNSLMARYSHAHSLGDSYKFDPRDGWESVNVTDLQYKYPKRELDVHELDEPDDQDDDQEHYMHEHHFSSLEKRAKKKTSTKTKSESKTKGKPKTKTTSKAKSSSSSSFKSSSKTKTSGVTASLKKIIDSIKGIGKSEPVTITWYTGHDLLNPSCWANTDWAPTDGSFAAALTLEGWTTKPACFKFLELCNSPKKCVFVRVIDSCAGCAKGSKHVDLTQAAFKELADLGTGILQVQMRQATDPDGWLDNLWGPKAS